MVTDRLASPDRTGRLLPAPALRLGLAALGALPAALAIKFKQADPGPAFGGGNEGDGHRSAPGLMAVTVYMMLIIVCNTA